MTYAEVKDFLARHTNVVELTDGADARVAVCPEWVGRVMTSTCDGPQGTSFGFINRAFIEAGKPDLKFNNYGGEERMWLSPEGGQFSLWFKPDVEETTDNWVTAPALNEGAWQSTLAADAKSCRMTATLQFENASATRLQFDVQRDVRLIDAAEVGRLFGTATVGRIADGVKMVGYETVNKITNRGADLTEATGLVSIWILGMLNPGPQAVVIVPYKPGTQSELGPVVKADYFGPVPADRLKVLPEAVLLRADAQYRCKIGTSQRRARNVVGSIDFAGGVLTVVQFTMPDDPTRQRYMNNLWGRPLMEPYVGDVVNSYNDGPMSPGKAGLGGFYEIESLSPAEVLANGESLEHRHRTVHIQADADTLATLAKEILGVDLSAVRGEMFGD